MNYLRHGAILSLAFLLPATLRAGDADVKNLEHAKLLQQLYPTPSLQVVIKNEVSYQLYQDAVNEAYKAGVPSSILNECVATRAMLRADAASLRQLLPTLREGAANYRPETSVFPDKAAAEQMVATIEKALAEEDKSPGSLANRAKAASEKSIARKIREQLVMLDALVDEQARTRKLPTGAEITEVMWRSTAPAGSHLAKTGTDELGHEFGPQKADQRPTVPKASYDRLKTVVPDSFWEPFGIPK